MPPARRNSDTPRPPRVLLSWLLAGLVLALCVLQASPSLHEKLHGHGHAQAHDDAGCAVTLFARGTTPPLELPRLAPPPRVCVEVLAADIRDFHPAASLHLRPPGRGPPVLG